MSTSKNQSSQGGPGTTGESSTADTVSPTDSGRGRKSINSTTSLVGDQAKATGRSTFLVGDQASATGRNLDKAIADKEKEQRAERELESGQVDKEGNFWRKPSTQRSPVQAPIVEEEVEEEGDEVFDGETSDQNEEGTRAILKSLGLEASLGGTGLVIIPAQKKRQSTAGNTPPEGKARKKVKTHLRTGKKVDNKQDTPLQLLKRDISNMADAIQDESTTRSSLQDMLRKIQKHVDDIDKNMLNRI